MLDVVNAIIYGGLMIVAVLFWRRRRNAPSAWLAATFIALGSVVVQGLFVPEVDPARQPLPQFSPREIYTDVVIVVLLVFPYLLHRFVRSMQPTNKWWGWALDVGVVTIGVWTFILPGFLPPDVQPTGQYAAYTNAFLGFWALVLGSVSLSLWRAGRNRPGVVRNRMRLMSVAAVFMNLALLGSLFTDSASEDSGVLITQLLGWGSAAGFLLAFEPPEFLRRLWRAEEEVALRAAETGLVVASSPAEAANAIVGAANALVGGDGAEVRDQGGRRLASTGSAELTDAGPEDQIVVRGDLSSVVVHRSDLSPIFGENEESLLRQLCGHLDLALNRINAFQDSETARLAAERANTELTQLVYGVSHDLRNPLVTVIGFLNFVGEDPHGLSDTQRMALDRISVSAKYMEGLIEDLLTLSRIGRTDADTRRQSVARVVNDIAGDLMTRFEALSVEVDSDADVQMNPIRIRQLFTNLLENAARHGGRDPLHVTVSCRETDNGMVQVDVADNGVGIPPDERERVFQIFQRLDRFDADAAGSGIGLTMCRRIAEDSGGGIVILDVPGGTTFRLTLPRATPSSSGPSNPVLTSPRGA